MTVTAPLTQIGERRLLVDGELCEASTGATFDNVNPATEQVLGVVEQYLETKTYGGPVA